MQVEKLEVDRWEYRALCWRLLSGEASSPSTNPSGVSGPA
jgi:hypothetical protein